jgi:ubiquinone/menaquinone biosynthesis C-methylase UbiE
MTVDLLEVRPGDHVLEIGFAHGKAIEMIASRASEGLVAGVDPSETMIKLGSRTNERFIQSGRVELKLGSISEIPYEGGRFDKVYTVNTAYFWPSPEEDLKEMRRVLKDGGILMVSFRGRGARRGLASLFGPGLQNSEVEELMARMEGAGFGGLRVEERKLGLRTGVCVIATK